MGITDRSGILKQQFRQAYWVNQLTQYEPVNWNTKSKKYYDILIFLRPEELEAVSGYYLTENITANVLFIYCPNSYFTSTVHIKALDSLAQRFCKTFRANGMFFFHSAFPHPTFLENLVINLLHNQGIIDAVQNIDRTTGRIYATKALNDQTRLTSYVEYLSLALKKQTNAGSRSITVTFRGEPPRKFTLIALSDFLAENVNKLPYTHESGTASTIKRISDEIAQPAVKKALKKAVKAKPATKVPSKSYFGKEKE